MTAVVISYRTRMAVREMGKVLGIEPDALDRLSRVISVLQHRENLDELRALLRQGGVDPDAPRVARLLELVTQVRGLPRHLGPAPTWSTLPLGGLLHFGPSPGQPSH